MSKITSKDFQKFWEVVNKSKNILIHLHPSPDADCTGGALSLLFVLKQLKKNITIISGDSEPPSYLSSLPGFEYIVKQNFFETDLNKFDLFIIQDTGAPNQISKQGEVVFPKHLKTIVIDHHDTNPNFGDINLIDTSYPATCQILYDLYIYNKDIKISKNIALNLFIGIYTDTGGFKYPKTSEKTFKVASELTKINPSYHKTLFNMENNDRPERLKFLSLMYGSIETYFSNHVAIASLSYETLQKNNLTSSMVSTSDVANTLKSVVGWDIGISFIEIQPEIVKISFRTRDANLYDLSKIAEIAGEGGGLKAAAGTTIKKPFNEAKQHLLKIIQSLHPELGKI